MVAPRNKLVDVLAIAFGISSWLEISGLGVEMPLMVDILPERWFLGSYIVVITQLANIGPLLYGITRKYVSHKVLEVPTIHITLLVAFSSCILLSFFWNSTSFIGGREHSTALFVLTFFLALVDCTSSVLYLPFMARFRDIYVISCMIGECACGLLPSIFGFVQGVGGNPDCQNQTVINTTDYSNGTLYNLVPFVPQPRFSISSYFIVLAVMVLISWAAFILLNKLPSLNSEKITVGDNRLMHSGLTEYEYAGDKNDDIVYKRYCDKNEYFILLSIQTFICVFQNGVLSSVQPFSCKPYGSIIYHLSVNLSLISNPLGCVVALFYSLMYLKAVIYIFLLSNVLGIYILVIATFSPEPPLMDSAFGGILMVFSWTVYVGTVSYLKAVIAAILRSKGGNRALFWGGAVSQIGSCVGGLSMFAIMSYTDLFKSKPPC